MSPFSASQETKVLAIRSRFFLYSTEMAWVIRWDHQPSQRSASRSVDGVGFADVVAESVETPADGVELADRELIALRVLTRSRARYRSTWAPMVRSERNRADGFLIGQAFFPRRVLDQVYDDRGDVEGIDGYR